MKVLLTAIFILAMAMPVMAEEDAHTICSAWGALAESVMQGRQNGVPMQAMIEVLIDPEDVVINRMMIEAYETSRFSTHDYQQRAISTFRDAWYLDCYKTFMRDKG